MRLQQEQLESKNQELARHFREKSSQQQKLHKMYMTLKQQQIAAGMEVAGDYDAEHVLQAAATGPHNSSTHRNGPPMQTRAGSHGSGGSGGLRQNVHGWENQAQSSRRGYQTSRKVEATIPSEERANMR